MSWRESNSGAVVVPLMILFRGFRVSQVLIGEREKERGREVKIKYEVLVFN